MVLMSTIVDRKEKSFLDKTYGSLFGMIYTQKIKYT